jgi:hypothetical protein
MPRARVFAVGAAAQRGLTNDEIADAASPPPAFDSAARHPYLIVYRCYRYSLGSSMNTTTTPPEIKRSDAVGLWIFMAAGAALAVWVTWAAVSRIIEVLPNRDIQVLG